MKHWIILCRGNSIKKIKPSQKDICINEAPPLMSKIKDDNNLEKNPGNNYPLTRKKRKLLGVYDGGPNL